MSRFLLEFLVEGIASIVVVVWTEGLDLSVSTDASPASVGIELLELAIMQQLKTVKLTKSGSVEQQTF